MDFRQKLFGRGSTPGPFQQILPTMKKDPLRPLGRLRPWAWWLEITRGCNLRCGFCATHLFPPGEYHHMAMETWESLLEIIAEVSPVGRLEIGNAGEPTLHPRLPEMLAMARKKVPGIQLMAFTNGTTLTDGSVTYESLFEAGLNFLFVDMYGPREKHVKLAEASGYPWQEQCRLGTDSLNVFEYHGNPDLHVIQLSEHPGNWPRRKVARGAFSTFFNHLDWKAAKRYGLRPVVNPPARRCDLPLKFPTIFWDGSYSFCCFDFMREVAGSLGNVSQGTEGFFKYWLGEYMQDCRRKLHSKDRAAHEMCQKCAFISIRADIPFWSPSLLDHYWTGKKWKQISGPLAVDLNPPPKDDRVRLFDLES